MLNRILAVVIPILLAFILRAPSEHDNVFINSKFHPEGVNDLPARVLLVTAHPDDESLFFAPTVISLLSHKHHSVIETGTSDIEVYFLCLSNGDADGLGKTRQHELMRSLDVLGIEDGKRWVLDHP